MTKTEARELITTTIMSCMAKEHSRLPGHVKIDFKGTKNYISFDDYGVYVCFYVTSSLDITLRTMSGTEKFRAIEYSPDCGPEELQKTVQTVFEDVLKALEGGF